MFSKNTAVCPVCQDPLGSIVKKEVCSYVCHDCNFVYTWNEKGKLLPPEKFVEKKLSKKCTCCNCRDRDKTESSIPSDYLSGFED
jgi:hypothetical protein